MAKNENIEMWRKYRLRKQSSAISLCEEKLMRNGISRHHSKLKEESVSKKYVA
jgi:hypothetical protein